MKPYLIVVDDAFESALDLYQFITEYGVFETVEHDGHKYAGICRNIPDGTLDLVRRIPGLRDAKCEMEFIRRNSTNDPVTGWIHADGGIADTAIVWYLSPDEFQTGGTALYRHKKTGWEIMPTIAEMEHAGMTIKEVAAMLQKDSHTEDAWERLFVVPAKFNRIVSYPAKCFHARYPKEGFGTTAQDSRLIYVAFMMR